MAVKTLDDIRDDIFNYVIIQLGPTYKSEDEQLIKNYITIVELEAMSVANVINETTTHLIGMMSIIIQSVIIAYENRGVESQTRQGELGQENHFIDWHQYLQDEVVSHGKRFVI